MHLYAPTNSKSNTLSFNLYLLTRLPFWPGETAAYKVGLVLQFAFPVLSCWGAYGNH
jgi:hypothetical protein